MTNPTPAPPPKKGRPLLTTRDGTLIVGKGGFLVVGKGKEPYASKS